MQIFTQTQLQTALTEGEAFATSLKAEVETAPRLAMYLPKDKVVASGITRSDAEKAKDYTDPVISNQEWGWVDDGGTNYGPMNAVKNKLGMLKLGDIYNDKRMFEVMPSLADIPVSMNEVLKDGTEAVYNTKNKDIKLGNFNQNSLRHETQHAVQDEAGILNFWKTIGNDYPKFNPTGLNNFDSYWSSPWEAQARLTGRMSEIEPPQLGPVADMHKDLQKHSRGGFYQRNKVEWFDMSRDQKMAHLEELGVPAKIGRGGRIVPAD